MRKNGRPPALARGRPRRGRRPFCLYAAAADRRSAPRRGRSSRRRTPASPCGRRRRSCHAGGLLLGGKNFHPIGPPGARCLRPRPGSLSTRFSGVRSSSPAQRRRCRRCCRSPHCNGAISRRSRFRRRDAALGPIGRTAHLRRAGLKMPRGQAVCQTAEHGGPGCTHCTSERGHAYLRPCPSGVTP